MKALIAAELIKLRTVRTTWLLGLILPLVGIVSLVDAALDPVEHNTSVVDFMDVALVVVGIAVAAFSAAQVGNEFQRRMVGLDYLAVPTRIPALSAKLVSYALAAAPLGFVAALLAHAAVTPIALGRDVPVDTLGEVAIRVLAVTAASVLLGAIGASIGILVPHPAIAVGAIIAWQIAEGVLGMALGVAEYLPIGLITTIAHLGGTVPLPVAFACLIGYTAATGAAALLVAQNRDLT